MSQTAIDRPSHQALFWLALVLFTTLYYFAYDRLYLSREAQLLESLLGSLKAWAIWLLLVPLIVRRTPAWRAGLPASAAQIRSLLLWVGLGLLVSTAYQAWVFRTQPHSGTTLLFCYVPANLKIMALVLALKLLGPAKRPFTTLSCQDHRNQTVELEIDAITHCTSDGNYLLIHTDRQAYTTRSTLAVMAKRLQAHGFIQIHRRHVVNATHIRQQNRNTVIMQPGTELPIGRVYQNRLS